MITITLFWAAIVMLVILILTFFTGGYEGKPGVVVKVMAFTTLLFFAAAVSKYIIGV